MGRQISSSDLHSLVDIVVGFSLCRIALTCLLMINTSYIISFHIAKVLPSNFWISTHVPDIEAILFFESEIYLTLSSFVVVEEWATLLPLLRMV